MSDLRHPSGTFDVLAPESRRWQTAVSRFAEVVQRAGYGLVLTPMFEDIAVFERVGASTDVVRKEMYDFEDKGGRHIALRPEVTASVARAVLENHPPLPYKAWYVGPNFRFERPQAGRYRQFHQVGIEAFGSADADLDVEVIALGLEYYASLGLSQIGLLINSLGDEVCRPAYRALLLAYLVERREQLCDEHRERMEENPLRVLDCKKASCMSVAEGAPRQLDHLCEPCATHFGRVRLGLDRVGVEYKVDTGLVRGLDYYTRTAFEYIGLSLTSAQNAVGGGGRYDRLLADMGGPATPAIGFALGIERILLSCLAEGVLMADDQPGAVSVFVVDLTGGAEARDLTTELRRAGISVDRAFDQRSAKAQFKAADRSGARLALVIGSDELAAGTVGIKSLATAMGQSGSQVSVARTAVVDEIRNLLSPGSPGSPGSPVSAGLPVSAGSAGSTAGTAEVAG